MSLRDYDTEYNLTGMISRPLYFGLAVNIMVPVGLLFVCYWINQRYFIENRVPEWSNILFYFFVALSLVQAGAALWWRQKRFAEPMVRRPETFEADIAARVMVLSKPIFLLIASISLWTYVHYFLTGRFHEAAVFVVFSFIVFQVVRPRYGSLQRLIAQQKKMVDKGQFYQGPGLLG